MEEGFLKLVSENQSIIHKVSRMYKDTVEDQGDLFQDIVLQLWKSYPHFRGESKVSTWIYRIALNTAMAVYRKSKPSISFEESLPDLPEEIRTSSELEDKLYQALYQLDKTERAIISLYLEDYNYAEISSIVGISENYTGVKINRIKGKLKEILR